MRLKGSIVLFCVLISICCDAQHMGQQWNFDSCIVRHRVGAKEKVFQAFFTHKYTKIGLHQYRNLIYIEDSGDSISILTKIEHGHHGFYFESIADSLNDGCWTVFHPITNNELLKFEIQNSVLNGCFIQNDKLGSPLCRAKFRKGKKYSRWHFLYLKEVTSVSYYTNGVLRKHRLKDK